MPGIYIYESRTNELEGSRNKTHEYLMRKYSQENDGIFAEDADYIEWLNKNGNAVEKVKAFTASLIEKNGHSSELDLLNERVDTFGALAAELNPASGVLSGEKIGAIRKNMNTLLGANGEKSLSEALYDFNKATDGKYAAEPEIKTVLSMVKRAEGACCRIEQASFADQNKDVKQRRDALEVAQNLSKECFEAEKTLDEQIMKNCAGLTPDEIGPAIEKLEKDSAALEKKIAEKQAQAESLRGELQTEQEALAGVRGQLKDEENELELSENSTKFYEKEKQETLDKIQQNEIISNIEKQVARELAFNQSKISREKIEADINTLNSQINEKYRETFLDKRKDLLEVQALSGQAKDIGYIPPSNMKKLLTSSGRALLREEAKTDTFYKNLNGYCDLAENFIRLYDKSHPAPKQGIFARTFGFGAKHETGEQVFASLVEKASASNATKGLDKFILDETDKLAQSITDEIGAIPQKNLLANYNREYDKIVRRQKELDAEQTESAEKQEKADREAKTAENKLGRIDRSIADSVNRTAGHKGEIERLHGEIAAKESGLADREKEIADLERSIKKDSDLNAHLQNSLAAMKKVRFSAQQLSQKRTMARGYISDLQKTAKPYADEKDERAQRMNDRLDGFLRRIADNQGSHKNSPEYNNLVNKLIDARQSGFRKFSETIPELEKAAIGYLHKKGSRTFSFGNLRRTRLDFAREIQGWAEAVEGSTLVSPAEFSEKERKVEQTVLSLDAEKKFADIYKKPEVPAVQKQASAGDLNKDKNMDEAGISAPSGY